MVMVIKLLESYRHIIYIYIYIKKSFLIITNLAYTYDETSLGVVNIERTKKMELNPYNKLKQIHPYQKQT